MGRLAATIREGRDDFSKGDTTSNSKGIRQDRGWMLKGRATASIGIDLELVRAKMTGTFTYGIESVGGSEIRYKKEKNTFIWSGVDTASWEDAIDVTIKPPRPLKSYKWHFNLPSLPLAGGAYQANSAEQSLNLDDMPRTLRQYGSPPAYGGAAKNWGGWSEAGLEIAEKKVQSYSNLQGYRDVDPGKKEGSKILPFTAPFFLIGVIRPMKDIEGQGPQFAAPLDLPYAGEIDGSLGAFAKAEVYHRPERKDGKIEKDNLFSPFWQARLVKTKNLDRLLGLALQQNVIWLSNEDAKNVPGMKNLKDKLQLWIGKLTALMGVLL
jgi:hypothetical protein